MDYPIFKGQEQLGKVQLLQEGLYYRVSCRCQRPGDQVYRLAAVCGGKKVNIGILVPMGDAFGIDKKIPRSHFGTGPAHFEVLPQHESVEGLFVPLSPTEPFQYLAQLEQARLARKDGHLGAVLPHSPT